MITVAEFSLRSRRKTQRVRIRPCLDVCQTVEQKCPYMLPGDRAPALPTQYAGEPTFLCRDLNIQETGEQLLKSNSGPTECCYDYCGSIPQSGVCARCDPLLYDDDTEEDYTEADMRNDSPTSGKPPVANSTNAISSSSSSSHDESSSTRRNLLEELRFSSELPPRLATCPSITSATTPSSPSEHCKSAQQLLLQRQQQQPPSNPNAAVTFPSVAPSSASTATTGTTTTTTTAAATVASSSASSLASSSSFIKLTSIKSIYNAYFNNSWTMRLRCLDEFVAWTKILLQLAGL